MRKIFISLLLGIVFISSFAVRVFAGEAAFGLYNPETKLYKLVDIVSVDAGNNKFFVGFVYRKEGTPAAVIINPLETYNENGILYGKAVSFMSFYQYFTGQANSKPNDDVIWKEFMPNTFFKKVEDLKRERAEQGMQYYYYD